MIDKLLSCLEELSPLETNSLYIDIVRLVAVSHVKALNQSMPEDIEEHADDWLEEVFGDTCPRDHELFHIVGESDLLVDYGGNTWETAFSLFGDACPYASDLDVNMGDFYSNWKLNRPENAVALIEDFYSDWRDRFFHEISKHASVDVEALEGNCTEQDCRGISVTIQIIDSEHEPIPGVIVEMSTLDGSFVDRERKSDENGQIQYELDYYHYDTVHAEIYLNGLSQGRYEFSGSECELELRG